MRHIYIPDFTKLADDELATVVDDLQFQLDVTSDYLTRAHKEVTMRRKAKREGRVRFVHGDDDDKETDEPSPTKH